MFRIAKYFLQLFFFIIRHILWCHRIHEIISGYMVFMRKKKCVHIHFNCLFELRFNGTVNKISSHVDLSPKEEDREKNRKDKKRAPNPNLASTEARTFLLLQPRQELPCQKRIKTRQKLQQEGTPPYNPLLV